VPALGNAMLLLMGLLMAALAAVNGRSRKY